MERIPERGEDMVTCSWEPLMPNLQKPPLESCARLADRIEKHSVEPALTVSEQDTYLYQSGWYRRVIGPFFGSDDSAFFVSVNSCSKTKYQIKKGERKWQTRKW